MPQNPGITSPKPAAKAVPAAQYVRMSTEHQQYSIENQRDLIGDYAIANGYEIVRTYADDGRSGLRIEGRDALKQMIADVLSGAARFKAILVYDVSRWGRFQDADEAAHYEFICKRSGIDVIYCAEQFANDGSTGAALIKSLKRHMAGEYSRELSTKVFRGQCRLVRLGYRLGGAPGFGLRRMLVDHTGAKKGLLRRGERKSIQTDRIILVPGPPDEVEAVRSIFRMFTREGKGETEIAQRLAAAQTPYAPGRPWTAQRVHRILTNEKYIGNNVFNRRSHKLSRERVKNAADQWVRHDGAFEAIVEPESFFAACTKIQRRLPTFSDAELIAWLRRMHDAHDRLTATVIDAIEGAPPSALYRYRFGSLTDAFDAAGLEPDRRHEFFRARRRLRALYPELLSETVRQLQEVGAKVVRDDGTGRLIINDQYSAEVVLARSRPAPGGGLRWRVKLGRGTAPDITIVARMDAANVRPVDYYVLPTLDRSRPKFWLREDNGLSLDAYRFESLSYFVQMSAQVRIEVAA